MAAETRRIKENPLVGKIVKDPNAPPDTLCLRGFAGASSEEGCIRLYFDNQFSDYVDVPESAILHSEDVPKEYSPFGAVYVWIERDAELTHGKAASERFKATFLQGRIWQDYQRAAAAGMAAVGGAAAPGAGPGGGAIPPPTVLGCVTQAGPLCTSFGPQCPTQAGTFCTLFGPICPTQNPFGCPPPQTPFCPLTPACPPQTPFCPETPGCPVATAVCPQTPFCPQTQFCPQPPIGFPFAQAMAGLGAGAAAPGTAIGPQCTSFGRQCPTRGRHALRPGLPNPRPAGRQLADRRSGRNARPWPVRSARP